MASWHSFESCATRAKLWGQCMQHVQQLLVLSVPIALTKHSNLGSLAECKHLPVSEGETYIPGYSTGAFPVSHSSQSSGKLNWLKPPLRKLNRPIAQSAKHGYAGTACMGPPCPRQTTPVSHTGIILL